MKIKKVENLVPNLHDKTEYTQMNTLNTHKQNVIHIWNLKKALNHGLVLGKVQRAIKSKMLA